LLTGSFTFLAYWLCKKQKHEEADKKLAKAFIESSGGKSVTRAIKFYQAIENFKQGN
jgi:hypothetical protein